MINTVTLFISYTAVLLSFMNVLCFCMYDMFLHLVLLHRYTVTVTWSMLRG